MRNLILGLFALCALAAGSSSAQANWCQSRYGWGNYPPQMCYGQHYNRRSWYGHGYRRVYGERTVTVHRRGYVEGGNVPSPEWIAAHVPHRHSRVCVPCIDGYIQDPGTCECTRTTWHPANDP